MPMSAAVARTMQQKLEQVCAPEIAAFCAAVRADPDALKACMLSHRDRLAPACRSLVEMAD